MRRVYNGVPDSGLQAELDAEAAADAQLKALDPDARCVYFPGAEGHGYEVWSRYPDRQITGTHETRLGAIGEAIALLKEDPPTL